jgi:molybdopterin converting factor small subunit
VAEVAGTARDEFSADTVAELLAAARSRYGEEFSKVAASCRVWLNGAQADLTDHVGPADEIALLPPVSGG